MKIPASSKQACRGSTLIAVVMVILVLSTLAGSILSHSWTSYRVALRQQMMAQTKLTAENEMEILYYKWKSRYLEGVEEDDLEARLISDGDAVDSATIATANHSPFLADASAWTTSRALRFDFEKFGVVPNTNRSGFVRYFTAQTRASRYDTTLGFVHYNLGRRFAVSDTSLFQFSVFYQGEMEIGSSSNMTIRGDLSSNDNVYIGSGTTATVTIADKVRYGPNAHTYNGSTDPDDGTVLRKPGTGTGAQVAPVFDPTPGDGTIPVQTTARSDQVNKMSEVENFLGGIDVDSVLANYTDAYDSDSDHTNARDLDAERNNVYRSVIAPPPVSGGVAVPEDPVIAANRMYNKASLVIKVDTAGNLTIKNPHDAVDVNHNYAGDAAFSSVVTAIRDTVRDKREGRNVKMTTIDVAALNTAIGVTSGVSSTYNGVVYVYDETTSDGAIRLVNGHTTPNYNDKGFTVATDNGLYVQGDYNTALTSGIPNRSALMGDAVTVLSQGWDDSHSNMSLANRLANSGTGKPVDGSTMAADNMTTIVAAIISGNTPSTNTTPSGGVQNLVRFLENWYTNSQTVTLYGSLGQLFTSKYFNSVYLGNGSTNGVYQIPVARNLIFDTALANNPPGGAPTTTSFARGDYFIWQ